MAVLGERIRERRLHLKLTQVELAARIGTNQKQVWKYENGENEPTAGVLAKLSLVLETTSDYLLGLTDLIDRPLRGEGDLSAQEMDLIEIYRRKGESDRKKVLEVVRIV